MTAAELAAEIAKRFECVQGLYRRYSQTGEPYVVIGIEKFPQPPNCIPGVVREGYPSIRYATEDEACLGFLRAFDLYVQWWARRNLCRSRAPKLYWRYNAPHVFYYPEDETIWGRLVLSNLPVVKETDEEYDAKRTKQLEQEIVHGQRQQLEPSDQE